MHWLPHCFVCFFFLHSVFLMFPLTTHIFHPLLVPNNISLRILFFKKFLSLSHSSEFTLSFFLFDIIHAKDFHQIEFFHVMFDGNYFNSEWWWWKLVIIISSLYNIIQYLINKNVGISSFFSFLSLYQLILINEHILQMAETYLIKSKKTIWMLTKELVSCNR